jgi:hypothetical protein
LAVVVADHYAGLVAEVILVARSKLAVLPVADEHHVAGDTLIANPIPRMDLAAAQIQWKNRFHGFVRAAHRLPSGGTAPPLLFIAKSQSTQKEGGVK